jgi:anti-sigma factor RsiW
MNPARPITEDDLQAHVDRRLDPGRAAEVEAYLAAHPEEARRTGAYAAEREALRAHFAPIAEEPVPPELDLSRLIAARRPGRRLSWQSVAAAVVIFTLGGVGGWTVSEVTRTETGGGAALARQAAEAYRVFGPDMGRPVEIAAADKASLVRWVSNRLQRPVAVPDLSASGYAFLGGRVVATPQGPAGMLMYDKDGARIALLMRPMPMRPNLPMSEHRINEVAGFVWSVDGLGYSLVGQSDPGALHTLADEARRQFQG